MSYDLTAWNRIAERKIALITGQLEKEIAQIYREAARETSALMGRIFEKYSVEGKITFAELEKYGRYDAINKQLNQITGHATQRARAATEAGQRLVYSASREQYRWAAEKGIGRSLPWGKIDTKAVEKIMASPLEKIAFERLRTNSSITIRRALAQTIVNGSGYKEAASQIREVIRGNAYDAMRIARTEGHRVKSEAHLERTEELEKMGATVKKIWLAKEDKRTRESHDEFNGQEADKDGNFTIGDSTGPAPGLLEGSDSAEQNIMCRCTYTEVVEFKQ